MDRTLIARTSAEEQLVRFLRRKKLIPFINYLKMLATFFRHIPFGFSKSVLRNKMYLRGLSLDRILKIMPEFTDYLVRNRMSPVGMTYFRRLKKEGYQLVLISGSLDFILTGLVERLGADGGIASEMGIADGKFTGWISGLHPYHKNKITALDLYLNGTSVDFRQGYAFGDSWADAPLLEKFGHPVAVNPGILLWIIAKKRKWTIIRDT